MIETERLTKTWRSMRRFQWASLIGFLICILAVVFDEQSSLGSALRWATVVTVVVLVMWWGHISCPKCRRDFSMMYGFLNPRTIKCMRCGFIAESPSESPTKAAD